MNLKIIGLCFLLLLSGCAHETRPILQLNGQPVSDKIVDLTIFELEVRLRYQLYKTFRVTEDDEFYDFKEYLSLQDPEVHKLEEGENLKMEITVFNPLKSYFQIVQHLKMEDGIELTGNEYSGDLSRKIITIGLPRAKGKTEWYFEVLDSKERTRYVSFTALYEYLVYDKDYDF